MTAPRRPAPEPLETDEVRVVAVGTALFAVGVVVTLVLYGRPAGDGRSDWVWISAAGFFLGLVGLTHLRKRVRALASARSDAEKGPTTTSPL